MFGLLLNLDLAKLKTQDSAEETPESEEIEGEAETPAAAPAPRASASRPKRAPAKSTKA